MTKFFQETLIKELTKNKMISNLVESGISKHQAQQLTLYQMQKKREAWRALHFEVEQTIKILLKLGYTIHKLEAST